MYVPSHFAVSDLPRLHAFLEEYSFALLCSAGEGAPFASHLPLLLDRQAGPYGTLVGHVARANPHWRLAEGRPVLAVFSGPHAYVSPAWYEAENVVPTWNYVAVHATGTFHAVQEPDALRAIVADMVARYEAPRPEPWRLPAPSDYVERQLRGIVGFRVPIERIEGKWKVGQNHPAERRLKAARALRAQGGEDAEGVARLMEEAG